MQLKPVLTEASKTTNKFFVYDRALEIAEENFKGSILSFQEIQAQADEWICEMCDHTELTDETPDLPIPQNIIWSVGNWIEDLGLLPKYYHNIPDGEYSVKNDQNDLQGTISCVDGILHIWELDEIFDEDYLEDEDYRYVEDIRIDSENKVITLLLEE